jgi:hypothetical protein
MNSPDSRQPQSRLHGRARNGGAPAPFSPLVRPVAFAPLGGTSSDGPIEESLVVTITVSPGGRRA